MTVMYNAKKTWDFMPMSLDEYNVSEHNGFLSPEPPLKRLPDPYYEPWENLVRYLVQYQLSGGFREMVQQLPLLSVDKLMGLKEYQRAYVVLGFLSHGYVWSLHKEPNENLPQCLSIPFCKVSEYLDINPIGTNASVVLWNWEVLNIGKDKADFPQCDSLSLDSLATLFTYTGSPDESWFYLVSVAIESKGGSIIKYSGEITNSVINKDIPGVISSLESFTKTIVEMTKLLLRMNERCDPYIFYWKVRPYLAGWENMESVGLYNGVHYDGTRCSDSKDQSVNAKQNSATKPCPLSSQDNAGDSKINHNSSQTEPYYRKYAGGSAAQSSLIQLIDILLGIKHYPVDGDALNKSKDPILNQTNGNIINQETSQIPPGNPYLMKMRDYMPGLHRKFLQDYSKAPSLRKFVFESTPDIEKTNLKKPAFFEDIQVEYPKDILNSSDESNTAYLNGNYALNSQVKMQYSLIKAYNKSVSSLGTFRSAHINIVKRYVVDQARRDYTNQTNPEISGNGKTREKFSTEAKANIGTTTDKKSILSSVLDYVTGTNDISPVKDKDNSKKNRPLMDIYEHGLAKLVDDDTVVLGTGGTDAVEFLKNIRDETRDSKI
ncbi:Indoleamine 2,3-dioxygenase [Smittium mucronatum]|uniref:Indoleamine 2,3-dioxygenase n=1 Tax=Smittium mucronatum TaxID=133383 RepID=A0A1R0H2V1_9FUNG|nr:Indoleamine 2,3-dioxygenase [Smittium mucronatum]